MHMHLHVYVLFVILPAVMCGAVVARWHRTFLTDMRGRFLAVMVDKFEFRFAPAATPKPTAT